MLLLTGMFTLAFNIQPAKASGTIYIRADGSIDPPTAPISTIDNITYTLTGNITSDADGIVVERDNIAVDGAGYTLQGTGSGSGMDISLRNKVTLKNTTVRGFATGIKSFSSSNNTISGNTIAANNLYAGIDLIDSSNCTVSANNITAHTLYGAEGISLYRSSSILVSGNNITNNGCDVAVEYDSLSNSIFDNEIANNGEGIEILDSADNAVSGNNFTGNGAGISLDWSSNIRVAGNKFFSDGLFVWGAYGNVVVDNLVNDRPLVYMEGVSDHIVDDAGQVILVKCNNIFVQNIDLSNTSAAVQLWRTNNTEIANNNMTNNGRGIGLHESSNITVCGNNIANNSDSIYLSFSTNITVAENKITNNTFGIDTYISSNITVSENRITNNAYGIQFGPSSGNNTIYHNSFIDNDEQVSSSGVVNAWDDGYPSGGNYWSDYTGTDSYAGPFQNGTGSDGIGDTPRVINTDNVDHYPLMKPTHSTDSWSMFHHDLNHTGYSTSNAPTTNHILWNSTTDNVVESSPAVADGRVYVGSDDSNVYCLDASTGAKLWNYTTGSPVYSSSPAIAGGKVYVGSLDHNVYCLDASTGTKLWNYTTGDQVYSSPAVADGKVYVGSWDGNFYCLNASSGAKLWSYATGSVESSSAVAEGKVYVGSGDGNVYCLDASTGTKQWNYYTYDVVDSSPAVADGKVYVGAWDGVYCFGSGPDVAVTNGTSAKTIIGQGYGGNVTVTAQYLGDFTENFNVATYANLTVIGALNFDLTGGSTASKIVVWNTTGFAYGNYTLQAAADLVPGETDIVNNIYTCPVPVHVGVPGDISGPTQGVYDGTTNMRDISYLILLFTTKPSSPNWNPNADVNNDGTVNMRDIQIPILNFNKHE